MEDLECHAATMAWDWDTDDIDADKDETMGACDASDDENIQGSKAWKSWASHVAYDTATTDGGLHIAAKLRQTSQAGQYTNCPTGPHSPMSRRPHYQGEPGQGQEVWV